MVTTMLFFLLFTWNKKKIESKSCGDKMTFLESKFCQMEDSFSLFPFSFFLFPFPFFLFSVTGGAMTFPDDDDDDDDDDVDHHQ